MVGFLLLFVFLLVCWVFLHLVNSKMLESTKQLKVLIFNVHSSSIDVLYLRVVGGMGEITFKKTECLVRDICRHKRAWCIWSKVLACGQC